MTKVLATGAVTNLEFYSPEGKTYKMANLEVGGKEFKGIFKRPQGLSNGMTVEVIENPPAPGKKYPEKEIRMAAGAPTPVAAATGGTGGYSRNPGEQDKISRQWATTQAIGFVNLCRETGALKKKVLENEQELFQLVGKYANLFFNAVQTNAAFEKLPHFQADINEASAVETTEA
jgi:hypothetical protein